MTADSVTDLDDRFDGTWSNPRGFRGFFSVVQHKDVGMRYMVTAFVLFLIGGVQAMFLRVQLAQPENDFLGPETYNELFTMHGTTMMFLFAIPFLEGLASYLLPLMIGSRDLPFPRYNVFNYWCYLLGGLILYSSFLFALVPDAGWFSYVPLSGPDFADRSMDFWLFGLTLAEIAAVGAAIEISVAILRTRAPGMTLNRMPIFAWTMLAVAFLIIVAFVPLIVASVLLELDRAVGTAFFDINAGGSPLLWQHLFWIFGHPEVYVMFLPGAAIISHVIPAHSGRPLVAYPLVVVALASTAVMSLGLWVHHMYTTGLPSLTMSFFTAASMSITLASGLQVFAWIATLWLGKPRFTVPMLYSLGFVVTFVLGGITGVMVASVALDTQVHDTYFVVAHFHYVLIGGMLFPVFAALHHWWGKVTGRHYARRPAVIAFWLVFVGFHVTFFPMHLSGLWGMPRRVYTYEQELGVGLVNLISTVGAFVIAAGVVLLTVNLVISHRRGAPVGVETGDSLEWTTSSPPPSENWRRIPMVTSRNPGWDRDEPVDADTRAALDEAFDARPVEFRATPLTTVLSAEPDGAVLLPRSTYWPLVTPVGLAILAVALLTQWYPLSAVGVVVGIVGLAGWAWRNESEYRVEHVRPLAGRFQFEAHGTRSIGWWAAASASIVIVVAVATLTFSALYLQVNASVWPLEDTVGEPVRFTAVAAALLAGLGVTWRAARQGRHELWDLSRPEVRRAQFIAVAVAMCAAVIALVLLVPLWLGDLDPAAHAYESSVWTLLGAQVLAILAALAMTIAALHARMRHRRDARTGLLLHAAALLWAAAAVSWAMVWMTSDLLPRLVI
ncbi:cytochrome ubiquinol oxidase subunit I [Aeromicrobium phragmitis]|uniref:Cytochrome ubiquinol oxidase subunit I n=1 Tax=Aeromicrobium phragmitis TaxID=2478914 RepID=A0A3L8PM22_9ACTN|nr:cbb3-type cytochrome c oxidase subunit I [Aeromicrobium phragmitis]RLV56274.1 cytochrome ubiquinol oxidase subunit I [Aeromicrobium phragmitis]